MVCQHLVMTMLDSFEFTEEDVDNPCLKCFVGWVRYVDKSLSMKKYMARINDRQYLRIIKLDYIKLHPEEFLHMIFFSKTTFREHFCHETYSTAN